MSNPTAALIIIGNEILSGRTKDKNLPHLAERLNSIGIGLREVRVIPDIEQTIIDTVNELRENFSYIFTTGGIGPTHDDITTASIAKAFGVAVERHEEAERRLLAHYKPEDVNEARMKMADIPVGADLIDNPVSAAPGFRLGNVHVMAGVPRIMEAMLEFILPTLEGGSPVLSQSIEVHAPEGNVADMITAIDTEFEKVEIGIYPLIKHGMLRSTVVLRSHNDRLLKQVTQATVDLLSSAQIEFEALD